MHKFARLFGFVFFSLLAASVARRLWGGYWDGVAILLIALIFLLINKFYK